MTRKQIEKLIALAGLTFLVIIIVSGMAHAKQRVGCIITDNVPHDCIETEAILVSDGEYRPVKQEENGSILVEANDKIMPDCFYEKNGC